LLKPELAASYRERIKSKDLPYLTKKSLRKKLVDMVSNFMKLRLGRLIFGIFI
jgi:hypothetical protein